MLIEEFRKQRKDLGDPEAVVISSRDVEELEEHGVFKIFTDGVPRGPWSGRSISNCRLIEDTGLPKGTPLKAWAQ